MSHQKQGPKLLSRDAFRAGVFKRDSCLCVFCDKTAQDAHHILERRLWPDGGYYIENGASVCAEHHMACETTEISVEAVREACGIDKPHLPPHLYRDQIYDKWGNPVLPNGTRLKGELFNDESVQKVLQPFLHLITNLVKYPRTYHLPWSPGMNDDDRKMESVEAFAVASEIIVTEKMDGENTTMYRNDFHARSVDGRNHPSRNWVKNFWSTIRHDIPEGWRVCGENLYAKHSIGYDKLPSYFLGFSIWNERNECLSWRDTTEWFQLLGIVSVPVLYKGPFLRFQSEKFDQNLDFATCEGYVMRVAEQFSYGEFRKKVAKWVRKNHVQTVKHWMHGHPVEPNQLA